MNKRCSFCNQRKDGFVCQGFRSTAICEDCVKLASEAIAEQKKKLQPQMIGDTRTLEQKLEASLEIIKGNYEKTTRQHTRR